MLVNMLRNDENSSSSISSSSSNSLIFKNAEQKLKLDGQVSKGGIAEISQLIQKALLIKFLQRYCFILCILPTSSINIRAN